MTVRVAFKTWLIKKDTQAYSQEFTEERQGWSQPLGDDDDDGGGGRGGQEEEGLTLQLANPTPAPSLVEHNLLEAPVDPDPPAC